MFEAVSGLTTTGLSTLPSVEHMPASFLFTRSWLQWYGGLVIVVVALAVIIGPSASARRLAVDEGEAAEGVASTRMRARSVLKVYGALTIAGIIVLWLAGATPADALIHSLSAISTGGFSNHDSSAAGLGAPAAVAVSLISLFGAISFSLQARAIRNPSRLWRDGEVRAIIVVTLLAASALAACTFATSGLSPDGIGNALFLAVSAQTTTGFATTPVAGLAPAAKLVLIVSMLIGGDMGSTAGGIKIFRLLVLGRVLQLLLARTCVSNHAVVTAEGRRANRRRRGDPRRLRHRHRLRRRDPRILVRIRRLRLSAARCAVRGRLRHGNGRALDRGNIGDAARRAQGPALRRHADGQA